AAKQVLFSDGARAKMDGV
nr:GroEL homolog {N-terminal} [Francisella tularensis, LVS, Peptide Partial, 18 aa] [Francisella tularensis]